MRTKDQQVQLICDLPGANGQPIQCLGMTFEDSKAVRQYFISKLAEKLADKSFRAKEGFPEGKDDDILALSNPPYYTACPNPWVEEIVREWEEHKNSSGDNPLHRLRKPYAADVSEGKQDPIYNAHTYHTKVPPKAIMRYILHYTEPGDIVFDGFCGTGMTGVAAQRCGDRAAVMSLGYQVDKDGTILREETDNAGKKMWVPFSKLGARKAFLSDLSPQATFIAHNYNTPIDISTFEKEARRILEEVEKECGWMYETNHHDGLTKGKIESTVWSDVFICPDCSNEVVFYDAAVDKKTGKVLDEFFCNNCGAKLSKRNMDHAWVNYYDHALASSVKQSKQVAVLIEYRVGSRIHKKKPDAFDKEILQQVDQRNIPYWFPSKRMPEGRESRRNDKTGRTHLHHFYTKRCLWILAALREKCVANDLLVWFTSQLMNVSKLNRYRPSVTFPYNTMSGTLYIGSQVCESNVFTAYSNKIDKFVKAFMSGSGQSIVQTMSSTQLPEISVDYIFVDPPFGANLNYSELSFIWECWLKVWTNNQLEAIENPVQSKFSGEYRQLITKCFRQAYRVLKPGRWMTVEFSNTKASVWNSIQTALSEAGFIVANVSALDKLSGSFKAVTTPTAVKQDLVISAYKPNGGFEERFQRDAQTEEGVWDFVRTHLKYLNSFKPQGIPERDPRILFDQMVAYYVRKGYPVPIPSQEFQIGLAQRFSERDGMYFLPDQVAEYDRKKMTSRAPKQLSMFVSDEASAILWLRQLLKQKPQTFADINPQFMQQLGGWSKNEEQLDLRELLNQNFLCYDGKGPVPEQIHSYLSSNWKELRNLPKDDPKLIAKARDRWYVPDPNKAGDLERLRERALLKEFEEYKQTRKKLKVFRLEAIRAGFKKAWQEKDYATIISVAEKIPDKVLEEDPKLLMWYDQAITRNEG